MLKFSHIRFHLCWNVEFCSCESALSRVTSWSKIQNWGRRDFMVIDVFHFVHVVKSILWTVNGYISVYIYWLVSVMPWGLYWVTALFNFVCQLDACWNYWASKCCYYCCLFCTLEQWLLHFPSTPPPYVDWVVWGLCPSLRPCLLCGNNLDRAQGILDNWRRGDVYVACLGCSIAVHVSLPEDVGVYGRTSVALLVKVIDTSVALGIGIGAALI